MYLLLIFLNYLRSSEWKGYSLKRELTMLHKERNLHLFRDMGQRYKICLIRKLLIENTREVRVKRLSFTDCKDCQLLLMHAGWKRKMEASDEKRHLLVKVQ